MKQVLLLISVVLLFFTTNTNAQLKPAQSQYLVEKGVLINPSFEQGYQGWVITGCAKSLVSDTPYLNKSLKLTCTNETFSIKQVSTALTNFSKQQGAFDLQIKTTASGVNVSSITNGVRDNAYSVINSTEFKRFKEIGFIVGGTDNGIEVYSDTNFTGEIILDNVKLGLGNLTQEIGTAHFVGKISLANNCVFSRTSATIGKMPDATCDTSSIEGDVSLPDNDYGGIKINNFRTDGYYRITHQGLLYNTADTGVCKFSLSKSGNYEGHGYVFTATRTTDGRYSNNLTASIKFNTGDTGEVFYVAVNSTATECNVFGTSADRSAITAEFFPDSKSTIVSQDTELTAKTDNSLNGVSDSAGNIDTQKYTDSGITSIRNSLGNYTIDYTSLGLTTAPAFDAKEVISSSNQYETTIKSVSTTAAVVEIKYTGNILGDADFSWFIEKQGADINKSQTIVGSFEQIRSDDLCIVDARGSAAQTITANTEPIQFNTTEYVDNCNAWDGDEFTAPKTTRLLITGSYQNNASGAFTVDVANQLGAIKVCSGANVAANNIRGFTCTVDVNVGDVVSMRLNTTLTSAGNPLFHHISITEIPTKESIVANLMQGQTTKCQTKILSADIASVGIIADLTFNNLVVGKRYRAILQAYMATTQAINIIHNGVKLSETYFSASTQTQTSSTPIFTASTTILNASTQVGNTVFGNSELYNTWVELCELPDTVIETTEFN